MAAIDNRLALELIPMANVVEGLLSFVIDTPAGVGGDGPPPTPTGRELRGDRHASDQASHCQQQATGFHQRWFLAVFRQMSADLLTPRRHVSSATQPPPQPEKRGHGEGD